MHGHSQVVSTLFENDDTREVWSLSDESVIITIFPRSWSLGPLNYCNIRNILLRRRKNRIQTKLLGKGEKLPSRQLIAFQIYSKSIQVLTYLALILIMSMLNLKIFLFFFSRGEVDYHSLPVFHTRFKPLIRVEDIHWEQVCVSPRNYN